MVDSYSTVLVTGASGFIGAHLVARLRQIGATVYCGTFLGRGFAPERVADPDVRIVALDDRSGPDTRRLEDIDVDFVFNLAAPGVQPRSRDVFEMLHVNVDIIESLFRGLHKRPPKLIVHTGSWSEYSNSGNRPLIESDVVAPLSIYGSVKASAALQASALSRSMGIPFVNLRLFNVYGPGEASQRLIPRLISRLQRNEPVELTPGDQVRDLTFVSDVIDALLVACSRDLEPYTAYNVCSGVPRRIVEVASTVAAEMGVSEDLLHFGALPHRSDEPLWAVGDNSRFRAATGWDASTDLTSGIRAMLAPHNLSGSLG